MIYIKFHDTADVLILLLMCLRPEDQRVYQTGVYNEFIVLDRPPRPMA